MLRCLLVPALCACAIAGTGCGQRGNGETNAAASSTSALKPLQSAPESPKMRKSVYVPVYSNIYRGVGDNTVELGATLSIRNISRSKPIVIEGVDYYDSGGKQVRAYLATPSELGPLASAEYVIQQRDRTGGTGASFLVRWSSVSDVDDPVVEAVMVGQSGNAGISFTSQGRPLSR